MQPEINFRIVVTKPPPGIDYALQKGSGNKYETIQKQRSNSGDLQFEFTAKAKEGNEIFVDFLGPFVQGPRGGRFIYIGIGTYAGQTNTEWSRRLKVPLTGISAAMMAKITRGAGHFFETKVAGTDKKGEPACATVKPFDGWKLSM